MKKSKSHDESIVIDFPYYATICGDVNPDLYGGVIISPNFVLTSAIAASAMMGTSIRVYVGTLSNSSKNEKIYSVQNVTIHHKYSSNDPQMHNIALLKLSSPIVFDRTINYVPLADNSEGSKSELIESNITYKCKFIQGNIPSSIKIPSNKNCEKNYENETLSETEKKVSKYLICTQLNDAELQNLCFGRRFDSLNGLIVANNSLVAIYSFSMDSETQPIIYTKISYYHDWIKRNSDVH